MFSDKVYKLLEGIPDQLEMDIEELRKEDKQLKKEMDDFDNDLKYSITKSRLLRRDMKGCRPVKAQNQQPNDKP